MDKKEKQALSESDICRLFIDPALAAAGWDPMRQIRTQVTLTPGPVIIRGRSHLETKNFENLLTMSSNGNQASQLRL